MRWKGSFYRFYECKDVRVAENMRMKNCKMIVWLLLGTFVLGLVGCGKSSDEIVSEDGNTTKVVLTTGFEEDEIFRIGNAVCNWTEAMVYLTNMQNQYEKVYGKQFWDKKIGDMTVEDKMKNIVLARIAQIKTMKLLAEEQNVSLTEEEKQTAAIAAETYFTTLTDREKELLSVTEKDIAGYYEEYTLANKVYDMIIEDTNPEISDDEARTVTVSQIVIKTVTTDADGQQTQVTDASKEAAYDRLRSIKASLSQGEDFDTLASRYNEAGQINISFGKGEMEQIYETTAFNLGTDEISDIFETSYGYVMLKCVSTFDQEQTQLNKEKILNERKKEAFSQIYDDFTIRQIRNLDQEMWDAIHFIHDPEVTTSSFFETYDHAFSAKG